MNITKLLTKVYRPQTALVIYRRANEENRAYVEAYDIDEEGKPINGRPLSENDARQLSQAILPPAREAKRTSFLQPREMLSKNVLHLQPANDDARATWYTPAGVRPLFFTKNLDIPSGKARVPALLWQASKTRLTLFALDSNARPTPRTKLYFAPFFNVGGGGVCMGNVDVNIQQSASLEEFMTAWEMYFFNSYFSHALAGNTSNPIVGLWQSLVGTNKPFPTSELIPARKTLSQLIS